MTRYFLSRVRIEGFRGINNDGAPLELRFDPSSVNSIFAVNGTGKSSIFEALSYAIRGSVPRLDELQAAENPDEYYVNKFHSSGVARIELSFTDDGNAPSLTEIVIERSATGARAVTSPSGHPDPDELLHSLNEAFCLLDYQSFTRFIGDSPLLRGRSFATLLGLARYSDFRQTLRAVADTRVLDADFEIGVLKARLTDCNTQMRSALARVQRAYQTLIGRAVADVTQLVAYETEVGEALGGIELIKEHIESRKLAEVDFDKIVESIRVAEGGDDRKELAKVHGTIDALEGIGEPDPCVAEDRAELGRHVAELVELRERSQGECQRHLFEAAEALVTSGEWTETAQCPLCGGALSRDLGELIQEHIRSFAEVNEKIAKLQEFWPASSYLARLRQLEKQASVLVDDDTRVASAIQHAVDGGTFSPEDLESANGQLDRMETARLERLASKRNRKDELEQSLPASLVKLTEQVEAGRAFSVAILDYRTAARSREEISAKLVARERWRSFIVSACQTYGEAEASLSSRKIASIGVEYKAMFRALMFVQDIVPELRRAAQREDLYVELSNFHGLSSLSARALLPESYRNALAISIFLAAAMRHRGTPRFIVLDDVTSSFDSGHQLNLMELIRTKLRYGASVDGLQFIVLSHDGQLEKYFDRLDGGGDWKHQRLQGSPPLGNVFSQQQEPNRLRKAASDFLDAGQIPQAQPLIRQYLEFRLTQVIRKVGIPVPIDFAMKDHTRQVSNCLEAIESAVSLNEKAGLLVMEPSQVAALRGTHVPAIVGNWVNHYETASGASISAAMLKSVLQSIDAYCECFQWDKAEPNGTVRRVWYRSLSGR